VSGLGALSQAGISAEAALPLGWQTMGLHYDADAERWMATASGPTKPTDIATGRGDDPAQCLHRLVNALRERPSPEDMRPNATSSAL
jgi:hypothetical protein